MTTATTSECARSRAKGESDVDNWYETMKQQECKHRELLREAARERLANGVPGN